MNGSAADTLRLRIDAGFRVGAEPDPSGAAPVESIPDGGEYAVAVRKAALAGSRATFGRGWIPDEVAAHLYAYEILERARATVAAPDAGAPRILVIPFWPECVFRAAGIVAHAASEILGAMPELAGIRYVARSEARVLAEQIRVFGRRLFDPARYLEEARLRAAAEGWAIVEEAGE